MPAGDLSVRFMRVDAAQDFLTGQLLIAMPNMGDQRFERSVVLICSHERDHAMGIVVNKRLQDVTVGELLQQLEIPADKAVGDAPVFYGGPVQQDHGLVVHTLDYQSDQTMVVHDNVGVTGTQQILADLAQGGIDEQRPANFLLALGHAGWSGGQLEEELQMNAWAHVPLSEDILFGGENRDIWRSALAKLGVSAAMLSPEWMRARDSNAPLN